MASDSFRVAAVLVLCASVSLAAPVFTVMSQRPYDVFHPLNFVALSLFFGVFGRTLFILTSDSPTVADILDHRPLVTIVPGAVLSMVGSLLLCTGFLSASGIYVRPRTLASIVEQFHEKRFMILLPLFFAICIVGVYFFLKATGFEYSGIGSISAKRRVLINDVESSMGYPRLLAQDVPRAILLLLTAIWCVNHRRTTALAVAIAAFGALAVALPFVASSRGNVIFAVITVCVVINRARGINLTALALAVGLSITVIFGMLALRRVNTRGASVSESIVEMGFEPLFGNHSFADVTKLAHIYDAVPELINYKYGESFIGVLYAPVPRVWWPDKPAIAMGREITEKIYNRGLDLKERGGGTPPGIFAESLINFSVYGFPVALLAIGAILRVLYNSLALLSQQSIAGLAIYGGVIPTFCLSMMSGDFTRALVQSLTVTGIIVGLCLLTRLKFLN